LLLDRIAQMKVLLGKLKGFIRANAVPLTLLVLLILVDILAHFGVIPSQKDVTQYICRVFEEHGLVIVVLFSFVENIILVNAYFPGSIVILTAMGMTAGDPVRAFATFLCIIIPAAIAQVINFVLGRYSSIIQPLIKEDVTIGQPRRLWILFLLTYWHPHSSSITSFMLGANQFDPVRFLANYAIFGLIWNSFWAVLMYSVGEIGSTSSSLIPIYYAYLILTILYRSWRHLTNDKESVEKRKKV